MSEGVTPEQQQEELRREIERTRADLGETVEALAHKADVKTQAREKVEHAKAQAGERPALPLAAGIGVALVALWLVRRKRRS